MTARFSPVLLTKGFPQTHRGEGSFDCLARKVLPLDLKAGSELRRFLAGLLGQEFFRSRSNQPVDLEGELFGKLCEVKLVHAKFDEENYSFPLVDVESMNPTPSEPQQGTTETPK